MRGSARSGRSPHPSPPASTRPSSPSSSRHASTRRARFLRGSIVPSAEDRTGRRGRPLTVRLEPVGEARWSEDDRAPRRSRGRRRGRPPCSAELANTTSHVARRVPGLAGVHRHGPRRAPLRMVERHEVVEDRRAHAARCGGYIHSLNINASRSPTNRSTDGVPMRLHAVRSACEAGSRTSRSVDRIPRSAARIALGPRRLVGANATSSWRPPAAAAIPASEPRM